MCSMSWLTHLADNNHIANFNFGTRDGVLAFGTKSNVLLIVDFLVAQKAHEIIERFAANGYE